MAPPAGTESPLLSIVTVVRNDREGLARTHASLRAQTCRRFAWMAVDGASQDGTREYLAACESDLAWWRSAPDRGLYDAMNIGLAAVRTPFVLFLNAGDRLAGADAIEWLSGLLAEEAPDFLYGDSLEETPDGGLFLKPARSHRWAWSGMFTHHQAMVYGRAVFAGSGFDLRYPIGADYAFTLEALRRSTRVRRVRRALAVVAPPGASARQATLGRRDQRRIRRDSLAFDPLLCDGIAAVQWAVFGVRRTLPMVYRHCRWRRPR